MQMLRKSRWTVKTAGAKASLGHLGGIQRSVGWSAESEGERGRGGDVVKTRRRQGKGDNHAQK